MNEELSMNFKTLLEEYLLQEGNKDTELEGLTLYRRDSPYSHKTRLYKPQVSLLAQGRKNIYLNNEVYTYDRDNYLVLTVPIPVLCDAIIKPGEPLLAMVMDINPRMVGEILHEMEKVPPGKTSSSKSILQAGITESLLDSAIRLLRSLKTRDEARVLGPLYKKEILFKMLIGENGAILRELAYSNRNLYQISRIINKMYEEISHPLEVQSLAREAGMSSSGFHNNFKALTGTSPLQYIKNIRLHKAKELIQQEGEKAYEAALRVGYESSSQFNREYKRLFGTTPAKDRSITLPTIL